ncbi:MAG: nucleotide sugar dehydrogenase [Clostridia bacterium]|nr:nucleotide sugar dehydrogenase [Clostridia bacterium]
MNIYDEIIKKNKNVGIIGLGYVGLPLFLELSKKVNTIGFDIDKDKIIQLKKTYTQKNIVGKIEELINCNCFIITVPTPIKKDNKPDLTYIIKATKMVSSILEKNSIVIYESTVYPGVTETVCKGILEESKLIYNKDFYVGYSPERINPGDVKHNLINITKIISASCQDALEIVEKIYNLVVNRVYRISSIKTAEAIKMLENTQRDLNIALMNEFSNICECDGINIYEVIEGASTKWNFYKCFPGLVGGHCIGVDPYYYIEYAKKYNRSSKLIDTSRKINEDIKNIILNKIYESLKGVRKKRNIIVVGVSYKPNSPDIRNSKILEIIGSLDKEKYNIFFLDEIIKDKKLNCLSKNELVKINNKVDLIIFASLHNIYKNFTYEFIKALFKKEVRIIEIGNYYKEDFLEKADFYWNL